jgi:hypothetical protein
VLKIINMAKYKTLMFCPRTFRHCNVNMWTENTWNMDENETSQ